MDSGKEGSDIFIRICFTIAADEDIGRISHSDDEGLIGDEEVPAGDRIRAFMAPTANATKKKSKRRLRGQLSSIKKIGLRRDVQKF